MDQDITWKSHDYYIYERGKIWKIAVISTILIVVILGVIFNAWTFSLAIVAISVVYYLVHRGHPNEMNIHITKMGIKMGKKTYPYSNIKGFWILYDPPHVGKLIIRVKGELLVDISIQLNDQEPSELRDYLMDRIPEIKGQKEAVGDLLCRLFKI